MHHSGGGAVELERVQAVLEALNVPAWLLGPDDGVLSANASAVAAGLALDQANGPFWSRASWEGGGVDGERLQESLREACARARTGARVTVTTTLRLRPDALRVLELTIAPLSGHASWLVVSAHERKAAVDPSAFPGLASFAMEVGLWAWDVRSNRLRGDANLARLFAVPEVEGGVPLETVLSRLHPEDGPRVHSAIQQTLERGGPYDDLYRVLQPDGSVRWLRARGEATRDENGRVLAFPGVVLDVTAQQEAETALRSSTERLVQQQNLLQQIIDNSPSPIWVKDLDGRYLLSNRAHTRVAAGDSTTPLIGQTDAAFGHDVATVAQWRDNDRAVATSGVPATLEETITGPDGRLRTFISVKFPLLAKDGTAYAVGGIAAEVTERLENLAEVERARRDAEHQRLFLDAVLSALPVGVLIADASGRVVKWNRATLELFNATDADYEAARGPAHFEKWKAFDQHGGLLPMRAWPLMRALLDREVIAGERLEVQRLDGPERRVAMVMASPVLDASGAMLGAVVAQADVTDVARAEQALKESEARFRAVADNIPQLAWIADGSGRISWYNRRFLEYTGRTLEELLGLGWHGVQHPDHLARVEERFLAALSAGKEWEDTFPLRAADGSYRWFLSRAIPISDAAGRIERWFGTNTDVTEQRAAEEQLRQAQRLQAVGQLAGGMAHELNNLLSASMAFDGFALEALPPGHPAIEDLTESLNAQQRAASITRQVLSFSRRGHLEKKRFDAAQSAREFEPLLRQSLAPSGTLSLMAAEAVPVSTDRVQLQQALLNLVLNARDAMPNGGFVTVTVGAAERPDAAAEIAPGRYGFVSVRDTGSGMSPDVAARVFEPFFSTKPVGQGTGLGLSQVYGFARQSEGTVTLDTRPGEGTTVTIWLPLAPGGDEAVGGERGQSVERKKPLVLIIDDEPQMRAVVRRVLRADGYETHDVGSGAEALAWLDAAPRSGLCCVVCDMLMPGMNGEATVAAIRERLPQLPVLFISGYPGAEARATNGQPQAPLLEKPFTAEKLKERVRALLSSTRSERPS